MKAQHGASITEVLIATALGLWLIGGVILCYLSNQRTSQLEQALARMQENGRMAINLLSQDIHRAGYSGCLPLSSLALPQLNFGSANADFISATRVAGWHQLKSTTSFNLPTDISHKAVANTDILLIQSMVPDQNTVVSAQAQTISLQNTINDEVGDILIIADCTHANIIRVTAVNAKQIIITPALLRPYNAMSQIGHLTSVFYYIRKTVRKNSVGAPIYALYRRDINQPATLAQEVVEGIEQMQLKFGVVHGHAIAYLPLENLTANDWPAVVSIQIALLLDSIEPIAGRAHSFSFNQKIHLPIDKQLRREWLATIAIREPNATEN